MVFVSQFMLQLCEIAIGSPTVVATKDEVVVKTAWPTSDKSLTSVSLTKHSESNFSSTFCNKFNLKNELMMYFCFFLIIFSH